MKRCWIIIIHSLRNGLRFAAGILTLEFADSSKIILNRKGPTQEIWVAAKSGGYHYRLENGAWRNTRDGSELFAHILCDLTGLELIGEHASAAACMDGVVVLGRAHKSRESELLALARLMPRDRFLGVLLVG